MDVVEHLVLKVALKAGGLMGTKYVTKYHEDLGSDLQEALETLEGEGWEVATAMTNPTTLTAELILKRKPR